MTSLSTLGPLPTTFALPSQCAQSLGDIYKVFTATPDYYLLQGPAGGQQTTCLPSSYKGDPKQVYSPARCPTGFTAACDSTSTKGSVTETILRCCPTNADFKCRTKTDFGWQETLGCYQPADTRATKTWTVHQVSGGVTAAALVTSTGVAGDLNAYQIQVAFQSTDFTSDDKTKKPKTTTKTTSKSKPTSGSSSSGKGKKKGKGKLGGGGIAGIIVGVLAGIAVLAGAIAVWWKRRRQAKREQIPGEDHDDDAAVEKNVVTDGGAVTRGVSGDGGSERRRSGEAHAHGPVGGDAAPAVFNDGSYRDNVDTSYRGGDAEAGYTRVNPDGAHMR